MNVMSVTDVLIRRRDVDETVQEVCVSGPVF